jgi:hypothetical protein
MTTLRVPIQTPRDPYRAYRTGIRRFASQDAWAVLSRDLYRWDIEIKAGQFVAERLAFGGDKKAMQLLFKSVEIRHGLACLATLP